MPINTKAQKLLTEKAVVKPREDASIEELLQSLGLDFKRLTTFVNDRLFSDIVEEQVRQKIPSDAMIQPDESTINPLPFRKFIEQELLIPSGFPAEEDKDGNKFVNDQILKEFLKNFSQGHFFSLSIIPQEIQKSTLYLPTKGEPIVNVHSSSSGIQFESVIDGKNSKFKYAGSDDLDEYKLDNNEVEATWSYIYMQRGTVRPVIENENDILNYSVKTDNLKYFADFIDEPGCVTQYKSGLPEPANQYNKLLLKISELKKIGVDVPEKVFSSISYKKLISEPVQFAEAKKELLNLYSPYIKDIENYLDKSQKMINEISKVVEKLQNLHVVIDHKILKELSIHNVIFENAQFNTAFDEISKIAADNSTGMHFWQTTPISMLNKIPAKYPEFIPHQNANSQKIKSTMAAIRKDKDTNQQTDENKHNNKL